MYLFAHLFIYLFALLLIVSLLVYLLVVNASNLKSCSDFVHRYLNVHIEITL